VVQAGTCIPDEALIGVASLAPKFSRSGETYVGCPPLKIKREGAVLAPVAAAADGAILPTASSTNTTYEPSRGLRLLRFLVEGLGFVALQLSLGLAFAALYLGLELPNGQLHDGLYVLTLPFFVMGYSALCALLVVAWKWLVVGRFRAGAYPLYGAYVWRTEFVERIEENLLQARWWL
jgi:MFS family permease